MTTESQNTSACGETAGVGTGDLFGKWTPIGEQMPKAGKKVLVCGHYENGNRWRTIAEWWPAGTMSAEHWDDPPEEWWDENGNNCLCPHDAWWESQVEAETMWQLSNVTHWQPLPSFPNTKLRHARAEQGESPER